MKFTIVANILSYYREKKEPCALFMSSKRWLVKLGEAQLLLTPSSYDQACREVLLALSNNVVLGKKLQAGELVFAEVDSTPLRFVSCERSFQGCINRQQRRSEDPIAMTIAPLLAPEASAQSSASQSSSRSSRMKRAFLSMKETESDRGSSQRSPLRRSSPTHSPSSMPVVMVWGSDVGRGAPIPFNAQRPLSYDELRRAAQKELSQEAIDRFVLRNGAAQTPDVDIEDDGDIATLVNAVLKYGADAITLTAVGRNERLSLSKQARTPVKANPSANVSTSLLTSPIAHREAPSPIVIRAERPKPAASIVQQLD